MSIQPMIHVVSTFENLPASLVQCPKCRGNIIHVPPISPSGSCSSLVECENECGYYVRYIPSSSSERWEIITPPSDQAISCV